MKGMVLKARCKVECPKCGGSLFVDLPARWPILCPFCEKSQGEMLPKVGTFILRKPRPESEPKRMVG